MAESQYYLTSVTCNFEIPNPRKLGVLHYFAPPGKRNDESARHWDAPHPGDLEWFDYNCHVVQFISRKDGALLIPFVRIEVALEGASSHELRIQSPLRPNTGIEVPDDAGIDSHIFLIRSLQEDTGWRIFTISHQDLLAAPHSVEYPGIGIAVPDLLTLPRLDDAPNKLKLIELRDKAHDAFYAAGGMQ